jgi:cyclic pyranopterin phosphate synthase
MSELTHLDAQGAARMVDVSAKPRTPRVATATGSIAMSADARAAILAGTMQKGDVIAVARIAGIMAAKRTSDLIPLCHPLPIDAVTIAIDASEDGFSVRGTVSTTHSTGVEMEALTAVSASLLTIYDMAKAIDRGMIIGGVRLLRKSGGRSGEWTSET